MFQNFFVKRALKDSKLNEPQKKNVGYFCLIGILIMDNYNPDITSYNCVVFFPFYPY